MYRNIGFCEQRTTRVLVCSLLTILHVSSAGGGASALSKLPSSKSSKSYDSKSYDDDLGMPDRSSGNTKSGGGFAGMAVSLCCTARLYSNISLHACNQSLLGTAL